MSPGKADPIRVSRALLVERAAGALAHEAKNPLHNMVLHLQLMAEKLPPDAAGAVERHLQAMRDGIGRVDSLLRAFSELATPAHAAADLGLSVTRALLLFGFEARRASVRISRRGPAEVRVGVDGPLLGEMVCHAVLAGIALSNDGTLLVSVGGDGGRARLDLRAEGSVPRRDEAAPHLEAIRRLAEELGVEPSIDAEAAPVARLSLSFVHPR